jgi:hypothetical protein
MSAPDIVSEAAAFYNEVWDEDELDLASVLRWGYALGPLRPDQVDAVVAAVGRQGFTRIEAVPQDEDESLREVRFSEVRVHTPDSFAERVRGLAELARQHGCELLDWTIEAEPGAGEPSPGRQLAFACHACGKGIVLPAERGGHVETCPHCGAFVDVPEAADAPPAAGSGSAPTPCRAPAANEPQAPIPRPPAALWIELLAVMCLGYVPWLFGAAVSFARGHSSPDFSVAGQLWSLTQSFQVSAPLLLIIALGREGWARFGIVRPKWGTDAVLACLVLGSDLILRALMLSFLPAWMFHSPAMIHDPRWAGPQGAAAWLLLAFEYAANAFTQELLMRGYLFVRLEQLLRSTPRAVVLTALLFGSYHIYQGITFVFLDVAAGILYALWFAWCRRLWPLCAAHAVFNLMLHR